MRAALLSTVVLAALVAATPPKPAPTVWSSPASDSASPASSVPVAAPQAIWIPPAESPGSGWRIKFANGANYHLSPCSNCPNQPAWIHLLRDGNGRELNASISLELMGDEFRVYTGSHAPRPRSSGMWHINANQFNPAGPNVLVNDGVLGPVALTPE